ncbi:MAG: (2Fe-2S) ferredoxin domain-containing protein [Anaerolineae bacterium]|nr:(2Fe-2S) ferredoxin domain-containing protein [Anaerolineae bacterium]
MSESGGRTSARKRVVLCTGEFCNQDGRAEPLVEMLRNALGDPVPAFMSRGPVTWESTNCLSLCGGGPNLVIYPDELWFHAVDADTLARIITEHLGPAALTG